MHPPSFIFKLPVISLPVSPVSGTTPVAPPESRLEAAVSPPQNGESADTVEDTTVHVLYTAGDTAANALENPHNSQIPTPRPASTEEEVEKNKLEMVFIIILNLYFCL